MVYSQVHYSPPTKRLVVHFSPFSAHRMGGGGASCGDDFGVWLNLAPCLQHRPTGNRVQLSSNCLGFFRVLPERKQTIRILFVSTGGIVGKLGSLLLCTVLKLGGGPGVRVI